jgi:hypothetical protein
MILTPEEVLVIWGRKLRSRVIREYRARWRDWSVGDATWESEKILQHPSLLLLEGEQSREGRIVMSLSK